MTGGSGNPAFWVLLVTLGVSGLAWLAAVVWFRKKRGKDLLFLCSFTIFSVYLYNVLNYTLFQYQSLVVLRVFLPDLMLNGQTEGNRLNLVPLQTLTTDDLKTSLLNLLMLMPFGFGLPFLGKFRLGWVTCLAAGFSLFIEVAQWFSGLVAGITFRIADVNDVVFNTLGAVVGYTVFFALFHLVSLGRKNHERPRRGDLEASAMREGNYKSGTSFSMPFGGTEIWFSELSGMGRDQGGIRQKLGDQGLVYQRSLGRRNVAINLVGTQLDGTNRRLLGSIVLGNRDHIKRLVIVGSGFLVRMHLGAILGKQRKTLGFRYGFLDDYEAAKRFLVET